MDYIHVREMKTSLYFKRGVFLFPYYSVSRIKNDKDKTTNGLIQLVDYNTAASFGPPLKSIY